jgi:hypothetical protein
MKQRKKLSKGVRIFVASCFGLVILIVILSVIFGGTDNPGKVTPPSAASLANLAKRQDSLIKVLMMDSVFKVTKVDFQADSTIKIHVKDPENGAPDLYFENEYHLLKTDFIREIAIYKGNKFLYGQGYISGQIVENWEKKYLSALDGDCIPLRDYLKNSLNDPESYDHDNTTVNYLGDSTFQVITKFRAKNGFGAKTLQMITATLDQNGNILKAKVDY